MNKTKLAIKTVGVVGSLTCGAIKGVWGLTKQVIQISNMAMGKTEKAKLDASNAVRDYELTLQGVRDKGFDVLVIGTGLYLYTKDLAAIAPEVLQAYQLAYPNEFARQDFIEQVSNLKTPAEILGFTNGLKGKLFEIEYAKNLNENLLPPGYHAALAASATQPGYDLLITGPDHQIAETLQLKATQSIGYIQSALKKYPDIKIVSTDEVLSSITGREVVAQGHVMASGITDHDLSAQVVGEIEKAQDSIFSASDQIPFLSIGIISLHESIKKSKTLYQKSFSVGERSLRSFANFKLGMLVTSIAGGIPAVISVLGFNYFGNKAEADAMLANEYRKTANLYRQKKTDLLEALRERTSLWGKIKRWLGFTPNW